MNKAENSIEYYLLMVATILLINRKIFIIFKNNNDLFCGQKELLLLTLPVPKFIINYMTKPITTI